MALEPVALRCRTTGLDETGFTYRARVGTTWAPVGRVPVLHRQSKRREVSSLIDVTAPLDGRPPQLFARHVLGTIHGEEIIVGLRYFRARIGRPLLIVWDHLNAHRKVCVREFLARHPEDYQVEWLPGYAPELNPEAQCNNCVKVAMLNTQPAPTKNSGPGAYQLPAPRAEDTPASPFLRTCRTQCHLRFVKVISDRLLSHRFVPNRPQGVFAGTELRLKFDGFDPRQP